MRRLLPLFLGILLALTLGMQSAHSADWPQFMRSSAHTGDAADESLKLPLGLATCVQLDDAITTAPAIVDGKVYVVDQMGTAYCIDPAANRIVWKSSPDGKDARGGNTSSACVANGRVYFGTTAGRLHVLDGRTGDRVRSFDAKWPITGSPTFANDSIYFQTVGAIVHCLDLDGKERWRWDHYNTYVDPKTNKLAVGFPGSYHDPHYAGGEIAIVGKRLVVNMGWDLYRLDDAGTQPTIYYTLVGTAGGNDPNTGDIYRGLDRFSRVKDLLWYNYDAEEDVERVKHGYDRVNNRTYRLNTVDPNRKHDEYYWYDRIQRLNGMERGELNTSNTGIEMLEFAQCWSLDSTGNWSSFREDSDGDRAWDFVQTRISNPANEISVINTFSGSTWISPAYDRVGNMTTIPQPSDSASSFVATYDPWNRLIKLASGDGTVAEYQYDGLKRRTLSSKYTAGVFNETRHHYYTDAWQVIEERVGSSSEAERQFVFGKRYVDDLVLRDRDANGDGSLDERSYGMQDANWNLTTIADSSGTVEERYSYAAYGMPSFMTAAFGDRSDTEFKWEHLFAGYRCDIATGLFQVRNRFLAPNLGTWIQRDPLGLMLEVNLYQYSMSNPINYYDPLGEIAPLIVLAVVAVGALAGGYYGYQQTGTRGDVGRCGCWNYCRNSPTDFLAHNRGCRRCGGKCNPDGIDTIYTSSNWWHNCGRRYDYYGDFGDYSQYTHYRCDDLYCSGHRYFSRGTE